MKKEDLIWIATVFDCEGCISSQKSQYTKKNGEVSYYDSTIIQLGHCSLDLITRFHNLVGMGRMYGHNYNYSYRYKTERKLVYWWKITNRPQVLEFVELIWDEWLSEYRRNTIISLGVAPMAKHPHRLRLFQNKTWRCALPGCRYFIHVGLAFTLPGQQSICNNCGDEFTLDEQAIKDEMPKCEMCRAVIEGRDIIAEQEYTTIQLALGKAGLKSVDELTPMQRNTWIALGILPKSFQSIPIIQPKITPPVVQAPVEKDEIEVIEADEEHAPECSVHNGGECDCR